MSIFIALIILSLLIFFHELGHFIAAKAFGVKVETFSIGFGKKVISKKIGDTIWAVSIIPLGGYVKMKGQDDTNPLAKSQDIDSYNSKKPWQRIVILLAGPFANFVVAFFLYFSASQMGTYLSPLFDYSHYLSPTIGEFSKESPAKSAGLRVGDKILEINGIKINRWDNLKEIIESQKGVLNFKILRDNRVLEFKIEPTIKKLKNKFGETIERRVVGIAPMLPKENLEFSFIDGIKFAYHETVYASTLIFQSIQKLLTGAVPAKELGGVITIVDMTAKASQSGILILFYLTALISVNLGVLNLLPIPALDGGHIVFNLYELITKKPPNEEIMYKLTIMGWIILLSLMALGIYNDINKILG
jgi:regulator of sigma E protease